MASLATSHQVRHAQRPADSKTPGPPRRRGPRRAAARYRLGRDDNDARTGGRAPASLLSCNASLGPCSQLGEESPGRRRWNARVLAPRQAPFAMAWPSSSASGDLRPRRGPPARHAGAQPGGGRLASSCGGGALLDAADGRARQTRVLSGARASARRRPAKMR